MEKRLKRIEILIIVLIVLAVANMVIPLGHNNTKADEEVTEDVPLKELPSDLNKKVVDKIVYAVKTEFNQADWTKLYDVYGVYAKAQLSPEQIESTFKKMKAAVGNIGTYAYSHYIYEGEGDNADWFEFQYKCRFKNGKGTIKISTRTLDGFSEVTGINIVLDEL